jgi:glycosyltransferase involved in cell wall biosynthesis
MNDVLLTISGNISPTVEEDIQAGKRPLTDYIAMSETFNADLIDYAKAQKVGGWFGRLLGKIGGQNALLAWACFKLRHQYQIIFSDGEQIAIPLALLFKFLSWGKRPAHFTLVHILSVGKKMYFFDWFGIQSDIDLFFVYSTWQKKFIEDRWQVPGDQVIFTPFMVDDDFFAPDQAVGGLTREDLSLTDEPIICSVGLEFRDYPTLLEAVKGIDVQVVVAAGSPWSKRSDTTEGQEIPDNVRVRRFSQHELRDLYTMSEFVVMPLFEVNFQAGVTAILEGMAMGKAIVCSKTAGQTDVIIDQENGLYVPPEDAEALHAAIKYLLEHPDEADRMGKNGRSLIENEMSLKKYVERLNVYVCQYRKSPVRREPEVID